MAATATVVYEGMYILDSTRYGREPDAVSKQLEEMVTKAGGEILVSRLWEERRLAYAIKGQRKGTYWLIYFRIDPKQIGGIRRQCDISETVLRTLFLKVDDRIVEPLVNHARTATVVSQPEGEAKPARGPKPVEEAAVAVDAIEDE